MADQEQLDILKRGVKEWNAWRKQHPTIKPDLRGSDLRGALLSNANLSKVNLRGAHLEEANLEGANLMDADLVEANLRQSNLRKASFSQSILVDVNLSGANLSGAFFNYTQILESDLSGTNLNDARLIRTVIGETNLRGADLRRANLYAAFIVNSHLDDANFTDCEIQYITTFDITLEGTIQQNLVLTLESEPLITIDHLEIAQFVYRYMTSKGVRETVDLIAMKMVLILGHFPAERNVILEALRATLRKRGFIPVLFDVSRVLTPAWRKAMQKELPETLFSLMKLSRYIIADLSLEEGIPEEFYTLLPGQRRAVQPVIEESQQETLTVQLFQDLEKNYPWVLPVYRYKGVEGLIESLEAKIIEPSEQKALEIKRQEETL